MNNTYHKPLKITVEFYNKKISTEIDHSDLSIDELHDLWVDIVRAMGYAEETIKKLYGDNFGYE